MALKLKPRTSVAHSGSNRGSGSPLNVCDMICSPRVSSPRASLEGLTATGALLMVAGPYRLP
eukprot:582198-Pyramimonas_sp.AAC.1